MPGLPPDLRLLDPARQQRLHGAAHPLPLAHGVEEVDGVATVDARRVEAAGRRLQGVDSAANVPEHASSRLEPRDRGKLGKYPGLYTNIRSWSRAERRKSRAAARRGVPRPRVLACRA